MDFDCDVRVSMVDTVDFTPDSLLMGGHRDQSLQVPNMNLAATSCTVPAGTNPIYLPN